MKIVLVKAAEPEFAWKKRYTPAGFLEAQKEWEGLPVSGIGSRTMKAEGYHVWTAASLHAEQTAEQWLRTGEGEESLHDVTPLLDEIPLRPFTDKNEEISLKKICLMGKWQWRRGDARQPESRAGSLEKADALIDMLEAEGEDAILISHERRILLLLGVLQKRGYQVRRGSLFRLEPMERILAARRIPTCGSCAHDCLLSHPGCEIGRDKADQLKRRARLGRPV